MGVHLSESSDNGVTWNSSRSIWHNRPSSGYDINLGLYAAPGKGMIYDIYLNIVATTAIDKNNDNTSIQVSPNPFKDRLENNGVKKETSINIYGLEVY